MFFSNFLDLQMMEKGALEKPKEEDEALKQKAVTYVQFEDLTDFEQSHMYYTDLENYIETELPFMIKDPEEWHLQFQALDSLRRINKFHKDIMVKIVPKFATFIFMSVKNERSGISKNSLMLLIEFFDSPNDNNKVETETAINCLLS
jgi:uncharacterized protein involved in cysteine biosynthesis